MSRWFNTADYCKAEKHLSKEVVVTENQRSITVIRA